MSEGKPVPAEFSKPEVIAVLKQYYDTLEEEDKVEVKLHGAATGEALKRVRRAAIGHDLGGLWRNYRIEEEVVVAQDFALLTARQRSTRFCAAADHWGN